MKYILQVLSQNGIATHTFDEKLDVTAFLREHNPSVLSLTFGQELDVNTFHDTFFPEVSYDYTLELVNAEGETKFEETYVSKEALDAALDFEEYETLPDGRRVALTPRITRNKLVGVVVEYTEIEVEED